MLISHIAWFKPTGIKTWHFPAKAIKTHDLGMQHHAIGPAVDQSQASTPREWLLGIPPEQDDD
jgi:hypothetical protein